jgi:hypothetical protein
MPLFCKELGQVNIMLFFYKKSGAITFVLCFSWQWSFVLELIMYCLMNLLWQWTLCRRVMMYWLYDDISLKPKLHGCVIRYSECIALLSWAFPLLIILFGALWVVNNYHSFGIVLYCVFYVAVQPKFKFHFFCVPFYLSC